MLTFPVLLVSAVAAILFWFVRNLNFTTAAVRVNELHEAHDEKRLLRLQRQLASYKLLIVDTGVPISASSACAICSSVKRLFRSIMPNSSPYCRTRKSGGRQSSA